MKYEVVNTHCRCHPETCCCNPYQICLDGEKVASGYDKKRLEQLAKLANKAKENKRG